MTKYSTYGDEVCFISVWMASSDTLLKTEVILDFLPNKEMVKMMSNVNKEYLHSWESLVAEFGGSLGLFLGFSFINLWEWFEIGIGLLRQLKLFNKVKIVKSSKE